MAREKAIVASIQVGKPRRLGREDAVDPFDQPWESGFIKEPTAGPVFLLCNLEHGHRRFRRNAVDVAKPVTVQHDITDDQHLGRCKIG